MVKASETCSFPDFPHCPEIELLIKTQDDATWADSLDWSLDTLTGEGSDPTPIKPDLIILYATGKPDDLESLLTEIRRRSTADILVPQYIGGRWIHPTGDEVKMPLTKTFRSSERPVKNMLRVENG